MRSPRAIFLDFDGALHPARDVADYASGSLPDVSLAQYVQERNLLRWVPVLAQMLDGHEDVMLVVHSGWRTRCQSYEIREFLGPLAPWFSGVTDNGPRYRSIMEVVDRFEIDQYVVIDDAVNEFPRDFPALLACDPDLGVTSPEVQAGLRQWLVATSQSEEPAGSLRSPCHAA